MTESIQFDTYQGPANMYNFYQSYNPSADALTPGTTYYSSDQKYYYSHSSSEKFPVTEQKTKISFVPAALAAKKTPAVEEFKRKIHEKAREYKKKKEQEAKVKKASSAKAVKAVKPAKVAKVIEAVEAAIAVTAAPEGPAKTEAPKVVPEEKAPVTEPAVVEPVAEASPVEAPVEAPIMETTGVPDTTETCPTEAVSNAAPAEQIDIVEEKVEETTGEDESMEKAIDISSFFDRLSKCKTIEDPFTFPYPYPQAGVDARLKAGEKKHRYDTKFLLQFQEAVAYPADDSWKEKLEGLGMVATKEPIPSGPRHDNTQVRKTYKFERRSPKEESAKESSLKVPEDKEETPAKPVEDVKPLVPSANRWVPRSRQKTTQVKTAPDGTVLLDKEDVERKVKSALNKLTLEMFEPVSNQMLDIAKQSCHEEDAATLKQVISLTFAKACDEPHWSTVYSKFCAKMVKDISDDIKDVGMPTKTGEPTVGGALARRFLLRTCQTEYEKGWVDKLPTNPDGSA
ncbi:hypothetical protein FT663_01951, partial [Candidozyma haemuli var. vulneris]